MSAIFEDNVDLIKSAADSAIAIALEKIGEFCEGRAQDLAPYDTTNLKQSITHQVNMNGSEKSVVIGTPSKYAIYQEMGTGIYAVNGDGRPTPWVYKDEKGNWHYTHGNKAVPFMKPSVADNTSYIKWVIEQALKGGST